MLSCLELFGDIVAIHPLPAGTLSFDAPFNVRSSQASGVSIAGHRLTLADVHGLGGFAVDGYYLYNNARVGESFQAVTIESGAKVKESDKTVAAGVYYTTKISATSEDDISSIHDIANELMSAEYFDCLVVDSLDNVFLIRGVEPATAISINASLPLSTRHSIEIEIVSVNGLLPVVFA